MLTRSEIIASSKKATRGAGFAWGMAEEAAWATADLYATGKDGFASLIEILDFADGKSHPLDIHGDGPICGLTLGVYLADLRDIPHELPEQIIGRELFILLINPEAVHAGNHSFPNKVPEKLLQYAARTYVPESAESRLKGAGEG